MPKHYCKHCKGDKEISHFYQTKMKSGNTYYQCKKYHAEYVKRWKNKDKKSFLRKEREKYNKLSLSKKKNRHLRKTYGITLADFKAMMKRQAGKCVIGNETLTKFNTHVDHCHATGKIRGLLCKECNVGLGNFTDSVIKLKKAITYLKESK